ncbi:MULTISPECIES: PEP-CTERM-box response regulator transcription factor [Sphingobium]|uniref:PEP-CTERM-box response regulator transcription factor n=1 Tax=Sphingobium tyrosinilyticum TaxID=2715436 RepID=A0ABV9EX74_9SPHN|nr:PEP-CTERM-box response regulator transcription factor [Sphingobium sp. EP60837]ANI77027.1 Putative response regulator NtrX-like [Sphingobium sp. EP60837]
MSDMRPKLLIVEDDPGLQRQLRWAYEDYQLFIAGDREEAIEMLRAETPDVVTLDLGLPPDPDGTSEGFATLAEMLQIKPDTKIIVASGHGARESALSAISSGAYDFYQKPVDIDELGLIVRRAFHVHALEKENARLAEAAPEDARVLGRLITAAPEMMKVARTIERVAATQVSVLLTGASGTGKELLAQGLHDASPRRGGPFITISCAAIPEDLLEAELFGGEAGKIALAHGGTLFLDEVGDISPALQMKLLRFVRERVVGSEGGEPLVVDTRIVCATHHDLEAMIAAGAFREDLYYRLAEIVVRIPALKERPGDAALLARHFLSRFAKDMNPQVKGLAPDALAALDAWAWPGNVRELENRIKRAAIMADGKYVTAANLDLDGDRLEGGDVVNLKAARELADRRAIRRAIARTNGNISGAAKMLGISRPTLYDLLKQYQMQG